ncbi:MAG: hypothetical protein HYS12_17255 [Planctomycetes bacterium]|nr:hypothetical protein [Planctomycetota bacterium]
MPIGLIHTSWLRLSNAGDAAVRKGGEDLGDLRRDRNKADYDERATLSQVTALDDVDQAEQIINALDAAAIEPVRSQITAAMRDYERDVLKDVTW